MIIFLSVLVLVILILLITNIKIVRIEGVTVYVKALENIQ